MRTFRDARSFYLLKLICCNFYSNVKLAQALKYLNYYLVYTIEEDKIVATAIIYIRVSTDEQAYHGFSQGIQQDILYQYCSFHNIPIKKVILEDYSAKTFNRPEWSKLLVELKRNKAGRPNLLLFTRWDRFSRNAADAYYMIRMLNKLGVEPQAIEQPLDLSVPENKITLAFYLVAPEVENDRRALNVKSGLLKGKQEGRWMGKAPIGYINKVSVAGQKYIGIHEPEASLMRTAFEQIALEHFNVNQAYKIAIARGLLCSKSNFFNAIHNPIYCGKIVTGNDHEGNAISIEGKHECIIPESLFNKVQKILKQKSGSIRHLKYQSNEMLPFRGFVYCPTCKKKLTGSASLGRTRHYYYYHCTYPCRYRIRVDVIHQLFLKEIRELKPDPAYIKLFKQILQRTYQDCHFLESTNQSNTIRTIERLQDNIAAARQLLILKEINGDDYHTIKTESEIKINILQAKLNGSLKMLSLISNKINHYTNILANLDTLFESLDISNKRKLIKWILSEQFIIPKSVIPLFSNPFKFIYNLPVDSKAFQNNLSPVVEDKATTANECKTVIAIENNKGNKISIEQAIAVVFLLKELSNLFIKQ